MRVYVSISLDDMFHDINTQLLPNPVIQEAEERGEVFQLQDCQNVLVVIYRDSQHPAQLGRTAFSSRSVSIVSC